MKLSLIGYYGGNFGDLLMLDTLISYYKRKFSYISIFTYGDKDILDQAISFHKRDVEIETVPLNLISIPVFLEKVKGSSALAWGGGTCFMDQGGTGGLKYMALARSQGIPIYYLGIGMDSITKSKTKLIVKAAGFLSRKIFLRDNKSLATAKKLGIENTKLSFVPDLALLHKLDPAASGGAQQYVVFSCRDLTEYNGLDNHKVNRDLALLVVRLCTELGVNKVVNLICDSETDLSQAQLCNEVFQENGILTEIVMGHQIESAINAIQRASFVVSARLHPAVLAHASGIRFAIYNYSDKNLKFTEEEHQTSRLIDRFQIENYTFDLSPIPNNIAHIEKEKLIIQALDAVF